MIGWIATTSWIKKQYFNSLHLLDVASSAISPACQSMSLFGHQFKILNSQDKKIALALYHSIIWFTYRENIQFYTQLYNGQIKPVLELTNDIGWGCMMRVGQMMLAHTLRVHAGKIMYSDQTFLKNLVEQFVLSKNGKFTVQQICKQGHKKIGRKVGQWYTPADIAYSLQAVVQNSPKQSNNLQVLILNGQFQLSSFLKKYWKKGQINIRPVLLVILVRLGYQSPQTNLLQNVVRIISEQPASVGILGGRPGKAHYIVGSTNDSFIYLDPHCVKDQNNIESFFPPSLFTLKHQKIDPSMGICFYVRTFQDVLNLHSYLQNLIDSPIYAYNEKKQSEDFYECEDQQEVFQQIIVSQSNLTYKQ